MFLLIEHYILLGLVDETSIGLCAGQICWSITVVTSDERSFNFETTLLKSFNRDTVLSIENITWCPEYRLSYDSLKLHFLV